MSKARADLDAVQFYAELQEQDTVASCASLFKAAVLPFGFDAVKPALELMSSYALEMKIIPRRYSVEELFDDTTRAL